MKDGEPMFEGSPEADPAPVPEPKYGTVFWSTPEGGEIEVTGVTSTDAHGYWWTDVVFVGRAVEWVRDGQPGRQRKLEVELREPLWRNRWPGPRGAK